MLISHKPAGVAPPFSSYSHGVEAPAGARWLHISGQVGVRSDGSFAEEPREQLEQTWHNLLAILEGAGMGPRDLVKVTAFLTRPDEVSLYRETRDAALAGAEPASSLIIVAGLAHPDWLVEIEAIAAAV